MPPSIEITTVRLRLRPWRAVDRVPFAAINADPAVMAFFPSTLTRDASDRTVDRWQAHLDGHGWGMWATEIADTGEFIGAVGLQPVPAHLPFAPQVEIGWRVGRAYWGRGYATEAASAAMRTGFEQLGLETLVSIAPRINLRSRAVMARLGLQPHGAPFRHPSLPADSPLCECCMYSITREQWQLRG